MCLPLFVFVFVELKLAELLAGCDIMPTVIYDRTYYFQQVRR